ncbi:MAG: LEA type 2 family protein [Chitinophagales bacterium]
MEHCRRIFIISGFVSLFLSACQKPMVPEYSGLENLQLGPMDGPRSVISANARFYNPNPFNVTLKKAEMNFFLNDKPADHFLLDSNIFIRAKDSFNIPITLRIDMKNIFSNALQSLISDQIKIRVEGHAKVKRGAFSFRVPIRYEETEKLSNLMKQ